jgi:hypothetical protein
MVQRFIFCKSKRSCPMPYKSAGEGVVLAETPLSYKLPMWGICLSDREWLGLFSLSALAIYF